MQLLLLVLLALTVAIAIYMNRDSIVGPVFRDIAVEEKQELQDRITLLEDEIEELTRTTPPAPSPLTAIIGEREAAPSLDFSKTTCEEIDQQIQAFFGYLDEQEYIRAYNLPEGSQSHLKLMVDKLLANPPIVIRETDSLFSILTNTAHFYRVLGKDNIVMTKEILSREADRLETNLALFDQWSQTGNLCQPSRTEIRLPLQSLYEYAGFFLTTLGGQSYLFRRNSHIRLMVKYYCIMILDRANTNIVNRHGIDIVPHLESLISEMEISETIVYKEHYIRTLRDLKNKYQPHQAEMNESARTTSR